MPYIVKLERPDLDPLVSEMGAKIDNPGKLAYILFAWFKRYIKDDPKKANFFHFALYTGTIFLTLLEIYRRIIARHEDTKIADPFHGDVE